MMSVSVGKGEARYMTAEQLRDAHATLGLDPLTLIDGIAPELNGSGVAFWPVPLDRLP